jgi:thiol-disulfide isomerase/thioredoxin
LSNGIEALISRMIALGPSAKRPPHMEFVVSARLSLTLVLSVLALAACSKEEPGPPQEQAQVGSLTGKIDRTHAGDLMPAVALIDPAGKALKTGALAGQSVLLNLWATWCAPCVKEMPTLDALAQAYDGKVRVITASQDLQGAAQVVPFFAKAKFAHLEPWLDRENALSTALGGDGVLPTTVLYDASGQEVARVVGGFDWESAEAKALVDEAVATS